MAAKQKKPKPTTFGEWAKERRERLGLTQAELAARSGIQQPTYCLIEKHGRKPRWDVVRLICRGLGASVQEADDALPEPERLVGGLEN